MKASTDTPALVDVVTSYDKISIDDYQRTYSWGTEQIDDFFEDLNEANLSKESHFFGTFILQKDHPSDVEGHIVDGQQRLTTVFILVSAIRDKLKQLPDPVIHRHSEHLKDTNVLSIAEDFLYPGDDMKKPRFKASNYLEDLMSKYVLALDGYTREIPKRDNETTLPFRKAVNHIRNRISSELEKCSSNEEKLDYLHNILVTLLKHFLVLRVETTSLDESLEIFLTLNNRGLPLGPSDLVRGQILALIGRGKNDKEHKRLQSEILQDWKGIANRVEEPEVFLRHMLVSTGTTKVQKKKVLDEVMRRVKEPNGAPLPLEEVAQSAKDFWNLLIETSAVYSKIVNPKMGGDLEYNIKLLENLTKSHRIFLLAVLADSETDANKVNEVVRLTCVLAYRWVIAGKNAQKLEDLMQKLSNLWRDSATQQDVYQLLKKEIEEVEFDLRRYFTSEAESSFVLKALLHGIHKRCTQGANSIPLDKKNLHIEHIAPQQSVPEWESALLGETSDQDTYDFWVSQAGNLTLLDEGINFRAGQKLFAEKVTLYSKSTIHVTRDLTEIRAWNSAIIKKRTEWLMEMFEYLFGINDDSRKVIAFSKWVANNE
jgi:uncharacterized protein with ParB-like and HNH nuclease domain